MADSGTNIKKVAGLIFCILLIGCSESAPKEIKGTWITKTTILGKQTVTFRNGEVEDAMGIHDVKYKKDGKSVIVSYKNTPLFGDVKIRYVINNNTMKDNTGTTYQRIKK